MRFAFDEEQSMLRDMFRTALEREAGIDKLRSWVAEADFSPFDACVVQNGWAGIGAEDSIGGQGGGVVEQALLFEALGHQAAPSGALFAQMATLALATRSNVSASDAAGLLESATPCAFSAGAPIDIQPGGRWVESQGISGRASFVLQAGSPTPSGRWLVPAVDAAGCDLWLVEADATAVHHVPRRMVDRTRKFVDVELRGAAARRIGRLDRGQLARVNAVLSVMLAAESLGLARRMLAMTVDYVSQRIQFGVPVGSFQAVKHEAAQMLVDVEAAHSGVYYAAWALDHDEADALPHAWIAKAYTCEIAARTADRALTLHGAIGYTLEHDLQFFFKRAKLNLELLGSPRHYRERIAASLSLLPPSPTNS